MSLLDTTIITTEVRISDRDLKLRMEHQLLDELGMLDDAGRPKPGVTASCTRFGDRGNGGIAHAGRLTGNAGSHHRLALHGITATATASPADAVRNWIVAARRRMGETG